MHDTHSKIAEVSAPAKINLSLLVGPRRNDGYHPVCSVMEKIKLFDTLRTMPEPEGAGIRLTGSEIPAADNIVMRAAQALEGEIGAKLDVDIELRKEIPMAAGLAGGSSDAAAILKLLVFMFGLEVAPERLRDLAARLGADVPFFLEPGPQLARGIGEKLTPVPGLPDYSIVLVKPQFDLPTSRVYEKFDEMTGIDAGSVSKGASAFEERCDGLTHAIAAVEDPGGLSSILQNDLESAAAAIFPEITDIKAEIMAAGAGGALMSGSGSSVFGIFPSRDAATTAAGALKKPRRQVWVVEPYRG